MSLPRIELRGQRSRAEELYAVLRAAILDGRLEPGERLVEEAVAAAASVSRTPVREALHRLEVDGLVKTGHRGMIVTAFTLDELSDLCSVRETLEAMATGLAAAAMTDLERATLGGIQARYREATQQEDVARLVEANHAFHETIWQGSRNRYLAEQLRDLRGLIERIQETTLDAVSRRGEALLQHEQIVEAIANRDARAAERIARQHFQQAMAIRLTSRRMSGSGAVS